MTEVKVPKWFGDRLLDDEIVISKYQYFYAINKRLIRSKTDSDFNFFIKFIIKISKKYYKRKIYGNRNIY